VESPLINDRRTPIFDAFLTNFCKLNLMKPNYMSYLLRVWQTGRAESPKLVASLEDPHSHQVTHFGSLEALIQYLRQSTLRWGNQQSPGEEQDKARTE
jgi:hypothetical protein